MNGNGIFTDAADITTRQTWDDSSRLTSQTDNNTNPTSYVYDELNRRVEIIHADGTTNSAAFDVHDNPIVVIDSNGTVVFNDYDLLNRLSSRDVSPAAGVAATTTAETYQYDGLGRGVLATNDNSVVTRAYDSLSHVTTETQQVLPGGSVASVVSTYDGVGNQLTCTYPGGRAITNTYDALNRISTVRDSLIAQYYYMGPTRIERRDYGNGTRTLWQYDGVTGVANASGDLGVQQITRTTHTNFLTGGLIDDRTYTWDRNANKQSTVNSLLSGNQNLQHGCRQPPDVLDLVQRRQKFRLFPRWRRQPDRHVFQ